MAKARAGGNGRNQLRIIGGQWRSRKLRFPDAEGLRPTADRLRETLFNWLQFQVPGSRCLDLFAGSGSLGLEALSREAAQVVFVERDAKVAGVLEENLQTLGATNGNVVRGDALGYLRGTPQPFDLVFLDPPFRTGLLQPVLDALTASDWIKAESRIYIEQERELPYPTLPVGWEWLKQGDAGQVAYGLIEVM